MSWCEPQVIFLPTGSGLRTLAGPQRLHTHIRAPIARREGKVAVVAGTNTSAASVVVAAFVIVARGGAAAVAAWLSLEPAWQTRCKAQRSKWKSLGWPFHDELGSTARGDLDSGRLVLRMVPREPDRGCKRRQSCSRHLRCFSRESHGMGKLRR